MRTLIDSIRINVPASKAFEWFEHFTENYTQWHPNHVKAEYRYGKPMKVFSRLYSEEYLHGELHKVVLILTNITPNQEIVYKSSFPMSILLPGGSFKFESLDENSCQFTATLTFNFAKMFEKFFSKRMLAIKIHMKEESINLKEILEKSRLFNF